MTPFEIAVEYSKRCGHELGQAEIRVSRLEEFDCYTFVDGCIYLHFHVYPAGYVHLRVAELMGKLMLEEEYHPI